MTDNHSALYAAFKTKDARFDGRFFVGISSTGIYCRPTCRAKLAKEKNCTFFTSAAEAEQAGYRPCLLCRPELAPGDSMTNGSSALARKMARLMEESCGNGQSLEECSAKLGYTDRHMRRIFMEEYHVSPIRYAQTCRLLLAKNLLTDTDLSVVEVAMAAGFGSLRRMNDLFQKQYKLSPTSLRKQAAQGKFCTGKITVSLGYRPPYQWDTMLRFLKARAIEGVELVKDGQYARTVCFKNREGNTFRGWVQVSHFPQKAMLTVTLNETLVPVISQVLACVRRLFDLYCDPDAVYETLQTMNDLRPGLCIHGTRIPGCFNPFETAVRAILGQQISVKAASTLAGRIARTLGTPIRTPMEGLTYTFPSAEDILGVGHDIQERLGGLGIISARSRSIQELAEALAQGGINLDQSADVEQETKKLQTIHGIGSWTAQYIAMRTMGWTDAFLETDAGIRKALQGFSPRELLELAEHWRPWRSYATVNLWNTL